MCNIVFGIDCPYCHGYAYIAENVIYYQDKKLVKCDNCGEIFYLSIDWTAKITKPKINKTTRSILYQQQVIILKDYDNGK